MKSNKFMILVCVIISAVMILCSCNVNTSTTDTKYKIVMIGNIKSVDEQTISGALWRALKANAKTISSTTTHKYYAPAAVSGSDSKSYNSAFTDAAKKQLELAAAGGAEIITLPSDAYSDAYLSVKDDTKNYGNIHFLILTVPGSSTSDVSKLNNKTTAVVINTVEYGYVFGYVLASSGCKTIGYLGIEGKTSEDFIAGLKIGSKAAADEKGLAIPEIKSKVTNPDLAGENAAALAAECDVIIGDELTQTAVAASGGKYASIFEDENAVMSFSVNCTVLETLMTDIIKNCKQPEVGEVKNLGIKDNIFTLKAGNMTEEEISALLSSVSELGLNSETIVD